MPPRPTAQELPGVEGPGVGRVKDKILDRLSDEFIEIRDDKAALAGKLSKVEAKIADRMVELGITKYAFSDQMVEVKQGKVRIKIKTVKAESVENGAPAE
jgi:hypothetical protein